MKASSDNLRTELLADLQAAEKIIRADLLAQYRADSSLMVCAKARLADEESSPSDVEEWLQTFAGRGAVLYILKTLYVRVLEDQGLLGMLRIRASGNYELFTQLFPNLGVAAYLQRVFDDAAHVLPELFKPTPIEIATPGELSARALWEVWQFAAPGGGPKFDFSGELDTRFVGDLYQDLDPDVKKRYALLQTPRFIEEFILDRTLDPALAKFGLDDFHMIDPTCGSGHFLVGAFDRLSRAWRARLGDEPEARWQAAVNALAAVHGADLNEYASALSRFRLVLAVVRETGVRDLTRLHDLHFNVITCDSLVPWERIDDRPLPGMSDASWLAHYGNSEERARNEAFFRRGYHAVVGNPPYVAVADKKKREDYRRAWPQSATGKYSLSAPMTERFVLMPIVGGFAGLIVANNFCKRSFGRGVIERVLPNLSLNLVVDTSGAYLPGHGTPTLMLFCSRDKIDVASHEVGVVAGKHGEPSEPADPARGLVWTAITEHWSEPGYEDLWIAVRRERQATFCSHPWSLGSDAVMRVKAKLDAFPRLKTRGAESGPAVIISEDDAFIRRYARALPLRPLLVGEDVRDWQTTIASQAQVITPYDKSGNLIFPSMAIADLWPLKTTLFARKTFVGTFRSNGREWYAFERYRSDRIGVQNIRIAIGEIATNNQFAIDRSDAISTQTAPILTLANASEETYRDVAAILNSSSLEFWVKQVCFEKGNGGINGGISAERWEKRYVRNGRNVLEAPLPKTGREDRVAIAKLINDHIALRSDFAPLSTIARSSSLGLRSALHKAQADSDHALEVLVALQEELDWRLYRDFGLIENPPLLPLDHVEGIARGHRPFEIALARRVAAGDEETAWFKRHGLAPTVDIPARYSGEARDVLERRLVLVESDETIALLEQPVHKRRWQTEAWETVVLRASETWLLDQLENELRGALAMLTADELVDRLGRDAKVLAVAELAKHESESTIVETLARLLAGESIPDNPARLFTAPALSKYIGKQTADCSNAGTVPMAEPFATGEAVDWKHVWRLQEREDAGELDEIAVPPPFKQADYAHPNGWKLRGKFNVPNERFIAFDALRPIRYAWGGWSTAKRADLSLRAYDLRGREPDGAPEVPTGEEPQRCAIQFALWDKIDELRRTTDPLLDEVRTLAQTCAKSCPCPVVDAWRDSAVRRRGVRARLGVESPEAPPRESAPRIDPALTQQLLAKLGRAGDRGLSLQEIEPLFSGNREAARATIEVLRSDGRLEVTGKGRSARFRAPQLQLFS